jgi:hypothetical protein
VTFAFAGQMPKRLGWSARRQCSFRQSLDAIVVDDHWRNRLLSEANPISAP